MDATFIALRDKTVKPFNPTIANGIATVLLPRAQKYIRDVWKSMAREFPPGLEFIDIVRCNPIEEFSEGAKKRTPTRTTKRVETKLKKAPKSAFDVARSDVFLTKIMFSYEGIPFKPCYLYLPFATRGGITTIGGSRFAISPILQDVVISPDDDSVFTEFLCLKLIFKREPYVFLMDGRKRSVQVVWANIYNKTPDMKSLMPTVKMETSMVHYLFCKYGMTETFERYLGFKPVVGGDEINTATHPSEDWVVCSCRGWAPNGNARLDYIRSPVKVAVPRHLWSEHVESFVGTFFYLVDHFSRRITAADVDSTWLWKVLLGHILWTGDMNEGFLHDKARDHLKSIDQYMDLITQQKLKSIGIDVTTTYDFFAHAIKHCSDWILQDSEKVSSMYGKEFSILNYVLYDITRQCVETNFAIHTAYRRSLTDAKRPLTFKTIEEIFKKKLKPGAIFRLTNGRPGASSIAIPGDVMAFKLTTLLVQQNSGGKNGSRRGGAAQSAANVLDASVAPTGGYLVLQKKTPNGRTRQNVYGRLSPSFITQEPEEFKHLLRSTNDKFRRR